jgi:hypothetical protein
MHNFWDAKDPSAMQAELTAAIKVNDYEGPV